MKIHYLQHVPFEGLGSIEIWARQHGSAISKTRLFNNEPLPNPGDINWLIVMGGPMNIYEEDKFPWLKREKDFIARVIKRGGRVLGICLGAQLIADVLGGRITANAEKEIGWWPIIPDPGLSPGLREVFGRELTVIHWHGDTFSLPAGASRLAQSKVCRNQGFVYQERVLALQFHLETTRESLEKLIANSADELIEAPYIQQPAEMLTDQSRFTMINETMARLLNYMAALKPLHFEML
ncbi:type 1 glutamine amidotransferase [Desulfobacterota bacterium M19]